MSSRLKSLGFAFATVAASACFPPFSSCVARGTRVKTPKGDRNVEDLEVGDGICALEPETGELVATVVAERRSARRECVALRFPGGRIVATSDHPLYCPVEKTWAPAGDWVLGKRTLLRVESGTVRVEGVETFAGVHEVFDLGVDHPLHNFLADGVLVHNKRTSPTQAPCTLPDGGVLRSDAGAPYDVGSSCECPDGDEGYVDCRSGALSCECLTPDADAGDGGG